MGKMRGHGIIFLSPIRDQHGPDKGQRGGIDGFGRRNQNKYTISGLLMAAIVPMEMVQAD